MPSFESPQVRPFRIKLVDEPVDFQIEARRDDEAFTFHVNQSDWAFLESILGDRPSFTAVEESQDEEFWRPVLGYAPDEELEFVQVSGCPKLLPDELFTCWLDNVEYEYDIWKRERERFEKWLALAESLERELPESHDWNSGPPEERLLRQLEFELAHALPDRVGILKRLHALGLLGSVDCESHLHELGCGRTLAWHRASRVHRWVSQFVDGMSLGKTVLSSPVGIEWFLEGPYQQRHLEPLSHLKFAVHQHLKREPPKLNSSIVVSMGGRISGAFFYQLGPGEIPQLVRGGEPQVGTPLYPLYCHKKTSGGDRIAELAARGIRQGKPSWGGYLVWNYLQQDPTAGQCWVELGVALDKVGCPGQAKACLQRAQEIGHQFRVDGELSALWGKQATETPTSPSDFGRWKQELESLSPEEQTAVLLCRDTWMGEELISAFGGLSLPSVLKPSS